MNNNWEIEKQKKIGEFDKEIKFCLSKLDRIRSNRISIETIKDLPVLSQNGEKKFIRSVSDIRITPNHELVIKAFDSKYLSLIIKAILDSQLGYELLKSDKLEVYFSLGIITQEIKNRVIKQIKSMVEESKAALRRIRDNFRYLVKKESSFSEDQKKRYEKEIDKLTHLYQDKIINAEQKKIKDL